MSVPSVRRKAPLDIVPPVFCQAPGCGAITRFEVNGVWLCHACATEHLGAPADPTP